MYCPRCGKQIGDSDTFCRFCGGGIRDILESAVPQKPVPGPPPSTPPDVRQNYGITVHKEPIGGAGTADDRKKPVKIKIIIGALVLCIVLLAALLIKEIYYPDNTSALSNSTATRTVTPKPTAKPTVRPTPSPTPSYFSVSASYERNLLKKITYKNLVYYYNDCVEWRINQYSGVSYDMSIEYSPNPASMINESADATTTKRHQINSTSSINIEYTKKNQYVASVIYLSDLKLSDSTSDKIMIPLYSLINAIQNIGLDDFDDILKNLKIETVQYSGESAEYDSETVHYEFYYLQSGDMRFEASIKTKSPD